MADLIYMTKAAWTAITDAVRGKTGETGLLKAGDVPTKLGDLIGTSAILDGAGVKKISNNTVTKIRFSCCAGFTELQHVNTPAVTTVLDDAFNGCTSLKYMNMSNITYIGKTAFAFGPKFYNVNLPKCQNVESAAFAWKAPYESSKTGTGSTGTLTLGNIANIGEMAFYCNGFSVVDITAGEYGATIGSMAFAACPNLSGIVIHGTSMVSLSDEFVFWNTPLYNGSGAIYVDPSMVDTYKTATNWSQFADLIEPNFEMSIVG